MRRLDEAFNAKLTVVSAPAGYGKTTLVSTWASASEFPIAWLSLDEDDNDPVRFLSYVVAAVQTIQPNLGREILATLQSAQPPAILKILPMLINQLDDIQERFVLVLDDYHLITSPAIHKAITFIIDHQPSQMHLAITTRIDPPLPLPQLRGRGQLVELRQADLCFSEDETAAFLKQISGIELPRSDLQVLVNRTEGWIAGLQMAALSMRNKTDLSRFIAGFGGSHEYIVDYFASEILDNLPEQVSSFLLKTSFLDRLCGSLCDEVIGGAGGQQMLERLQEANLFLVPLDDEHVWYRYHQLFADLLHKNLFRNDPSDVPELHLRASRWFEHHEFPHKAVEHAFLAKDYPRVARLLEEVAENAFEQGESAWLLKWIDRLPPNQLESHPRLGILRVTSYASNGLVQRADNALQTVEAQLQSQDMDPSAKDYAIGRVTALRAIIAILRRDVDTAQRNAKIVLDQLSRGTQHEAPWRAYSWFALGLSNFAEGDPAMARQNLAMAIQEAKMAGGPFTFLAVTTLLVEVLWDQGYLKEAIETCNEGIKFIDKNGLRDSPMSAEMLLDWCLLLCERYDLGQANDFLIRGTELARDGNAARVCAWAAYVKLRYLIAQGDLSGAESAMEEADQLLQASEFPLWITNGISALKVLIWVRLGKLDLAEQCLNKRGVRIENNIQLSYEHEYVSFAALLMAKGDVENAGLLLDRITARAEATKQSRTLICARTLQSIKFAAQKEKQKALQSLARAIELAEPEGYALTILELGENLAPLLYEAIQKGIHPGYASWLLECFNTTRTPSLQRQELQKGPDALLIPLREREILALSMAAEGLTNKEIAVRLHVSLRTVKFYMTSIFTKLEVENRLQAVARARDLGIIL